jgi:2-polyprenyl-3-methyl-5-hydroxy-6-metoxy-1,4-benzoquinol methylase
MFDILNAKASFFKDNEKWLAEANRVWKIYKEQPARKNCKLCGNALKHEKLFSSNGVDFLLCDTCGHLNGECQDTDDFSRAVYSGESLGEFYKESSLEQYISRMESIYIPKALFLSDSLKAAGADYGKKTFLDVGAGCGYMVGALRRLGLSATGIEVSQGEVKYGNRMLDGQYLKLYPQGETAGLVRDTQAQVICFIGVLEHLYELSLMLESIQNNKNIQFMFFSVPMFSLANVFGIVFPDVFNRQLITMHTHLFSRRSLEWMYKNYGFKPEAEWNFGTDITDLYRSVMVRLSKENGVNDKLAGIVSMFFKDNVDSMQLIVDKSDFCSEVHVFGKN